MVESWSRLKVDVRAPSCLPRLPVSPPIFIRIGRTCITTDDALPVKNQARMSG